MFNNIFVKNASMKKHKKIQTQKHKNSKKMINDFQNIQYTSIRKYILKNICMRTKAKLRMPGD